MMVVENAKFEKQQYTQEALKKGEYDTCTFLNCVFSETDLSNIAFTECEFYNCDFSNAKVKNTVFNDVVFSECKLIGIHFNNCNPFLFSAKFNKCNLSLASFYQVKIKNTTVVSCELHQTDFTQADISNTLFEDCDFKQAIFEQTILEKANLSTAYNYTIDPENNSIKKAQFSMPEVLGLLKKYDIHVK